MKKKEAPKASSCALPSIPVLDERIYRILGRDKACRSCDDARDTAMAIIVNVKK